MFLTFKTLFRPIVGRLTYNLAYFGAETKDTEIESDIYTTLHEITHVLGFSKSMFSLFVNPGTNILLTNHLG